MSYEGYEQVLCTNGHYHTYDAMDFYTPWSDDTSWKCSICGAPEAWHNSVNLTNGSWETDENGIDVRIDGYVELDEAGFEDIWQEDHYGNKYATKRILYKIPKLVQE